MRSDLELPHPSKKTSIVRRILLYMPKKQLKQDARLLGWGSKLRKGKACNLKQTVRVLSFSETFTYLQTLLSPFSILCLHNILSICSLLSVSFLSSVSSLAPQVSFVSSIFSLLSLYSLSLSIFIYSGVSHDESHLSHLFLHGVIHRIQNKSNAYALCAILTDTLTVASIIIVVHETMMWLRCHF